MSGAGAPPILVEPSDFPTISPNLAALATFLASSDWKPPNLSALALIFASISSSVNFSSVEFTGTGAFSLPFGEGSVTVEAPFSTESVLDGVIGTSLLIFWGFAWNFQLFFSFLD